jgi:hypothetical protein
MAAVAAVAVASRWTCEGKIDFAGGYSCARDKMNLEERAQLLQDCDEMGINADKYQCRQIGAPQPHPSIANVALYCYTLHGVYNALK